MYVNLTAGIKRRSFREVIQALFIPLLVARGLFQIVLPKTYAILLHLLIVVSFALIIFPPYPFRIEKKQIALILFSLLFFLVALLSCLLTTFVTDTFYWLAFFFFNLFAILFSWQTLRIELPDSSNHDIPSSIIYSGIILLLVALGEQLWLYNLPGESELFTLFVRPASLTGSFLHYPLMIALFGGALLQIAEVESRKKLKWLAFCFLLIPIFTLSRSGIVISSGTLLFYPLLKGGKEAAKAIRILLYFLILCIVMWQVIPENSPPYRISERIFTMASPDSTGNSHRIDTWKRVGQSWSRSNLFFGEEAGYYTNSSNNIREGEKVTISESSPLLLLSNYGILGLILFYLILFQIYRFIHPTHTWLQASLTAALFQTLVYQSIEVLPFILYLFLLPIISKSLNRTL